MSILKIADNSRTSSLACWHQPAGSPRLVSLWDMLRAYADDFHRLLDDLDFMIGLPARAKELHKSDPIAEVACKETWKTVKDFLSKLELVCEKFELDAAVRWIQGIRERFDATVNVIEMLNVTFLSSLDSDLKQLPRLIVQQLDTRMFMYVPMNQIHY
jgi:hypothetical protein